MNHERLKVTWMDIDIKMNIFITLFKLFEITIDSLNLSYVNTFSID